MLITINNIIPADETGYMAAMIDKRRLLKDTPPPRVILVGGSNLVFGADSKLLAQKLGIPVVNYGLHGGLGLTIILNSLQPDLRSGDIVVISPEYEMFYSNWVDGETIPLTDLLEVQPDFVRYISPRQSLEILQIYVAAVQLKVMRQLTSFTGYTSIHTSVYQRSCFDPTTGDAVCHLSQPDLPPDEIPGDPFISENAKVNPVAIEELNHFYEVAHQRGASVLFDYPPGRMRNCNATGPQFDELANILKSNILFPILSSPRDNCFPDDNFFNTQYHLNALGRKKRTELLAERIQNALK